MRYECVRRMISGQLHDLVYMEPGEEFSGHAWRVKYEDAPLKYWNGETERLFWIPVPITKSYPNLDQDGYLMS